MSKAFLDSEEVLLKEKKKTKKNPKHVKFVLCKLLKWNYKIFKTDYKKCFQTNPSPTT